MAEWLSIDDLSKYLKVPRSSLYKLIRAERLPGHKIGRSYRFDKEEVDAWVKGHRPRKTTRPNGDHK